MVLFLEKIVLAAVCFDLVIDGLPDIGLFL